MPKPSQSWFKRFFYNQNIKRDKSNDKYRNLLNHIVMLVKRVEKEWLTNRSANAIKRSQMKATAYGISLQQMIAVFEHKWLSHLQDILHQHFSFVQKARIKNATSSVSVVKKVVPVKEEKIEKEKTAPKKAVAKKVASPVSKEKKVAPKKAAAKKTTKKETK